MQVRELVLSEATGGETLRLAFHPRLTVLSGLPAPARRELLETLITASAGGRSDRSVTTDSGPPSDWLAALAPGRPGGELIEELARLDSRLMALDEHDARVAYHQAVTRLEAATAELAQVAELEPTAAEDATIMTSAEAIEDVQERLTSAVDRAERCRRVSTWTQGLLDGSIPTTQKAPAEASSEVVDLVDRWTRAQKAVAKLERELVVHRTDEVSPGLDRRIALLAPLDQDRLWDAHRRVKDADAHLADAVERRSLLEEDLPEELETAIDTAHIERVRAEEMVAARWRPGILGSSVPAAAPGSSGV